jgi:ABC-type Na+ transport system ATPase subunit NatA
MRAPIIDIKDLVKRYGERAAVDGVSLTVQEGEIFGLLVQGAGLVAILPQVAALTAFATLFFGLGVWRFRFE